MTSVLALQYSTNWAMETHMLGADQFTKFIFTSDIALGMRRVMKLIWTAGLQDDTIKKLWNTKQNDKTMMEPEKAPTPPFHFQKGHLRTQITSYS